MRCPSKLLDGYQPVDSIESHFQYVSIIW